MIAAILIAALSISYPQLPQRNPDVRPDTLGTKVRVSVDELTGGQSAGPIVKGVDRRDRLPSRCFVDMSNPDYRCALRDFPDTGASDADLDPGDILRAVRDIGMPPHRLHIQPSGRTLVNIETIFYTDPVHLRRTVTLLGHSVRLDAEPIRFTWVHGDGTQETTSNPGQPYPAKDVTHEYQQPGVGLRARVDTTYRVRYRVDGGGWNELGETLTATGPATRLDVDEAAPVLTH